MNDLNPDQNILPISSGVVPVSQTTKAINRSMQIVVSLIILQKTNIQNLHIWAIGCEPHIECLIMWNKIYYCVHVTILLSIYLKSSTDDIVTHQRRWKTINSNAKRVVIYFSGDKVGLMENTSDDLPQSSFMMEQDMAIHLSNGKEVVVERGDRVHHHVAAHNPILRFELNGHPHGDVGDDVDRVVRHCCKVRSSRGGQGRGGGMRNGSED